MRELSCVDTPDSDPELADAVGAEDWLGDGVCDGLVAAAEGAALLWLLADPQAARVHTTETATRPFARTGEA